MDQTQNGKIFTKPNTTQIFLRFAAAARTLWSRKNAKIKIISKGIISLFDNVEFAIEFCVYFKFIWKNISINSVVPHCRNKCKKEILYRNDK